MSNPESENIGDKVRRGIKWSILEKGGLQALQVAFGIVLARILLPEDFGLITMLAVFTAVASYISDGGLSQALVQRKNPSETDLSTIFYFNLIVGSFVAVTVCLCAPLAAAFYEEPRITALLRVMSINILITSLTNVQTWMLNKDLEFKAQFKAKIVSTVIASSAAIALASSGFGPWSLVAQSLALAGINSALIWTWSGWRPSWSFSFESLRSLLRFSIYLFVSGQLTVICSEAFSVIIGKLFSVNELGIFARAKQTQEIPTNALNSLLSRISFPAFSMLQDDPSRQLRAVRKSLHTIAFFHFPIILGLAATSENVVELLLTSKWAESAGLLNLYCFAGILAPTISTHLSLLLSTGDSKKILKLSLMKNAIRGGLLLFTWRWGLEGLIYGEILFSIISYLLHSTVTARLTSLSVLSQFSILLPYMVAALLMYTSLALCAPYLPGNLPIALAMQIAIGATLYLFLCQTMKLVTYFEYRDILIRKLERLWNPKHRID